MRKFRLGQLLITPGATRLLDKSRNSPMWYLHRHSLGDWGSLVDEDKQANDAALKWGGRLMSAYDVEGGRIWIITEADRSATTILLPEEY